MDHSHTAAAQAVATVCELKKRTRVEYITFLAARFPGIHSRARQRRRAILNEPRELVRVGSLTRTNKNKSAAQYATFMIHTIYTTADDRQNSTTGRHTTPLVQ